jgi:hypothetical protein
MIVRIIGWFCLGYTLTLILSVIFNGLYSTEVIDLDKIKIMGLFLIAASICFK